MRPILLKMKAFGSYARETAVNFAELKDTLYLITGDTGAGKTTLFDAIVFALYGVPSGKDRSVEELHSDFVDKSVDTEVELSFEHGGKQYKVSRTIHFRKSQKEKGQFTGREITATLEEPGRDAIERTDRVTRRVEELLGLNAEQFRKIVMLAQGEFREFLQADSNKKNEILGKLFDNSAYLRYQNLLDSARKELDSRRKEQREELRRLLEGVFRRPESMTEEQLLAFLPENPALLENLRSLCAEEEEQLAALGSLQQTKREQISALDSKKGAAEALNSQFSAMEQTERELAALLSRTEEMERRKARLELAEMAYHKVRPFLEGRERTERALRREQQELLLRRQDAQAAEEGLRLAQADAGENQRREEELRQLGVQLATLEEQLAQLRELGRDQKSLAELKNRIAPARETWKALHESCGKKETLLQSARARLAELSGAEAALLQAGTAYESAMAQAQELEELQEQIGRSLEQERELREAEETLGHAARQALLAEEEYHGLYRRFLAGQAGLMAKKLREEIRRGGEADCPVCGSRLQEQDTARFAVLEEDVPDQTRVEAAKKAMDRAENERSRQDKNREAKAALLQSRRETLLQTAGERLPGCESWEQLLDGRLTQRQRQLKEQIETLKTRLEAARASDGERRQLSERLPLLERELEQNREKESSTRQLLQELQIKQETLEGLIRARAQQLRFASEAEALGEQGRLRRRRESLALALDKSKNALESARSRRDTAQGGLREKEELLRSLETEREQAVEELERSLEEAGFASVQEAEAALPPREEGDGALWLRQQRQRRSEWESDLSHKRQQLEQQKRSLEGREPVDLAALLQKLDEEKAELAACSEAWGRQENLLSNHRQVLSGAERAKNALAHSEKGWRRLDRLASLAMGAISDEGRLSFDRYVMGAVFREILEMANRRMDIMSGGRYQLIHRSDADRKNARAGLEIQVLDLSTGRVRGSDSLSGGEGFFTSLSLALGLADTVQNRAGGHNLDALFIDEGFGSLSQGVLETAVDVLKELSKGQRLVGIISHVAQLEECITQKIRVRGGGEGSSLTLDP